MDIIVGLGNPGKQYDNTRHNVGFIAVNHMVDKLGGEWKENKKFNAMIYKDWNTLYVKPLTFMNNSGMCISRIISYFNLLPKKFGVFKSKDTDLENILTVLHDDLDIKLGKIKIAIGSRSAGHNGVQSIINHLKTKKFKRIRIGISTDDKKNIPTDKFVLGKFKENERKEIQNIIKRIDI